MICLSRTQSLSPTPLREGPLAYDTSKTNYVSGENVEVVESKYVCQSVAYEQYATFSEEPMGLNTNAEEFWDNAWQLVLTFKPI